MADHTHRVVECSLCGQVTTDCGCDPNSINRGDRIHREVRPMPCCQAPAPMPGVRGPIICRGPIHDDGAGDDALPPDGRFALLGIEEDNYADWWKGQR